MIRLARESDIPNILELLVQVNMVHHIGRPDIFKGPTTKYSKEEILPMLTDDKNPIFVYEDESGEKEILGYAFCQTKETKENNLLHGARSLYIDDLCVFEDARGKHIGESLYKHVRQYAIDKGYTNVTLNVWGFNEAAMGFYEKMGMSPRNITMEDRL